MAETAAYFDMIGGVSGDMLLGAMVGVGLELALGRRDRHIARRHRLHAHRGPHVYLARAGRMAAKPGVMLLGVDNP